MKTCEEFNEKYKNYLPEGWYGCSIEDNEKMLTYLDEEFQEFIKVPEFKYHQIKSKFSSYRFYAEGLSREVMTIVEQTLKRIDENRTDI